MLKMCNVNVFMFREQPVCAADVLVNRFIIKSQLTRLCSGFITLERVMNYAETQLGFIKGLNTSVSYHVVLLLSNLLNKNQTSRV